MSSPVYELYFRTAVFDDVSDFLDTFAGHRDENGRKLWTYPPHEEKFDLTIERDDDWDEFVRDIVDVEFSLNYFQDKSPCCSLYIEGRKWAGLKNINTVVEIAIKLLSRFDGLFATEVQLFTLDELRYWIMEKTFTDEIIDYRAIRKTDDLLTGKRIALGIRQVLQDHCWSDPYFETGDDKIRGELTKEVIELGEVAIPIIAIWLESENKGLVNTATEIIAKIGGDSAH